MIVAKYSANGNDFIIFYTFVKKERNALAKKLCHRQNGIGADGLIVLTPHEKYDFEWQFYNADGSNAAMCGNGSRVAAHYAYKQNLAPKNMHFLTGAGVIEAKVDANIVTSELTPPQIISQNIEEFKKRWWLIDTGVPHLVGLADTINTFNLKEAKELRYKFNANVNIAVIKNGSLYVRTYERGVEDETLACGTGMAACFLRANLENKIGEKISVVPTSGEKLELAKKGNTLTLKGKVQHTFNAIVKIEIE